LCASPDLCHGAHRLLDQWPANPERKVQPRRLEPTPDWILVIIDQIDTAHEQHGRIDQRELAVQAPKRLPLQTPAPQWPENAQLNPLGGKDLPDLTGRHTRAKPIHHEAHGHATRDRATQRPRNPASTRIIVKNVGFDPDRLARRVDGRFKRREKLRARLQQLNRVPGATTRPLSPPKQLPPRRRYRANAAHPWPRSRSAITGL
jgi:hypothetical protein